ncbi:MAG: tyramine oxidase, partial [Rhodospirillales bacterium]|nr:tyramine oxidase [Rhodospirillales bacterium]
MDDLHLPASAGPGLASTPRHPMTPLDAGEIRQVVAIIRADAAFGADFLFEVIELKEPPAACEDGKAWPREARANVFLADKPGVWRLSISLADGVVTAKSFHPEARPMIQLEQFIQIEDIVRAHPDFIAACAKRGVTDMSKVCVDPWSAGNFGVPGEEGGYLSHTFCWLRLYENENFYAHPIEGINAVVDIKAGKVIRVDDYGASVPVPMGEFNYEAQFRTEFRKALKPLDIIQPEGASFVLDGRVITWDKWRCVIGFNAREGLTLHDISYDGRPIVNRASIAEMVVPYGVPENGHFRKNVFDIGEYGLGKLTNSLTLGCDCLGHIAYLDADLNTMHGD